MIAALTTMLATQAAIVFAMLALPVLAPLAADVLAFPAEYVGLYVSVIFGAAMLSALMAPGFISRWGALRTNQVALATAALGLLLLLGHAPVFLIASAIAIGIAYGPSNPASSRLLSRLTPEHRRSSIFSLKQTGVPLGGALSGLILPPLALALGLTGALIAAAAMLLAVSVAVQPWRARLDSDAEPGQPLIGKQPFAPVLFVLSRRRMRILALAATVFAGMQFVFSGIFVTYLVARAELGLVEAGAVLSAALGTSVVARILWGVAADRFTNERALAAVGLLMAGASFTAPFVSPGWSLIAIYALGCWFGAAAISWNGVYLAAVAEEASAEHVASATAGTMFLVFGGAFAGPALYTAVAAATGNPASGFVLFGLLTALTAIAILFAGFRSKS